MFYSLPLSHLIVSFSFLLWQLSNALHQGATGKSLLLSSNLYLAILLPFLLITCPSKFYLKSLKHSKIVLFFLFFLLNLSICSIIRPDEIELIFHNQIKPILFFFLFGFISFHPLLNFPLLYQNKFSRLSAVIILTFSFLLFFILYSYNIFFQVSGLARSDITFLDLNINNYQTIAYSSCLCLFIISSFQRDFFRLLFSRLPLVSSMFWLVFLVQSFVLIAFMQLLGSNISLIYVLLFFISFLVFNYYLLAPKRKSVYKIIAPCLAILSISFSFFLSLLFLEETLVKILADYGLKLRAYNYGYSATILESSSLTSRLDLFFLASNDLFSNLLIGNPASGVLTGDYVHSLVALLPNTGIIGSVLFAFLIYYSFLYLKQSLDTSYLSPLLVSTLFVSLLGTFYSFEPIWFVIGCIAGHEAYQSYFNLDH